ncbi:hypothetical protein [Spiroplasma endosymbiont of Labia minor]|uniref:hypothetical protein n=1 Tax=Spiroplasma endosymbiont of Labia minor TaxID=3066305 RepID=UPI0030CCFED5
MNKIINSSQFNFLKYLRKFFTNANFFIVQQFVREVLNSFRTNTKILKSRDPYLKFMNLINYWTKIFLNSEINFIKYNNNPLNQLYELCLNYLRNYFEDYIQHIKINFKSNERLNNLILFKKSLKKNEIKLAIKNRINNQDNVLKIFYITNDLVLKRFLIGNKNQKNEVDSKKIYVRYFVKYAKFNKIGDKLTNLDKFILDEINFDNRLTMRDFLYEISQQNYMGKYKNNFKNSIYILREIWENI